MPPRSAWRACSGRRSRCRRAARYRTGLEKHLRETEAHAERVQARLRELSPAGANPLLAGIGLAEAGGEPDAGPLEDAAGSPAWRQR